MITTGVVSAATLANAIVLFLQDSFALQRELGIACVVLALALVTAWGIGQSVAIAVAITFVEVAGLLFVILISGPAYARFGEVWTELVPAADAGAWTGIGAGAFLIFYA